MLGLAHVALPQGVFTAGIRQAPLPLQKPSSPHCFVVSCVHSLSGSAPVGTEAHFPLAWPVLALEHATHFPLQPVSQQNPSTQNPVAHSLFAPGVQAEPAVFLAAQVFPGVQ